MTEPGPGKVAATEPQGRALSVDDEPEALEALETLTQAQQQHDELKR